MKINNMEFDLQKGSYHKTILQDDGITYKPDTTTPYYYYNFSLSKNYFDTNKVETIDEIQTDLQEIIHQLTILKDKCKSEERDG